MTFFAGGSMKITEDILYAGVNDTKIDLFEGQFHVPNGMSYNSYIILDEKTAVMDSVDHHFGEEWISNIEKICGEKTPDFLIVHHAEPDHSANILRFAERFPNAKIVSSLMAFNMLKNYFGTDFSDRRIIVKEGDTLSLGKHTLQFISAPNVHWPEVMFSFEQTEKVLFSADGFGKFGAIDEKDPLYDWECEARRYYFGIVGKFGANVQTALKKASSLDIKILCPLHGPVLSENVGKYIQLYDIWSSYGVESEGIAIAYTSVYGHTEKAVKSLEKKLLNAGCKKCAVSDLARCDIHEAVEDAFRYGTLVLATVTYNCDIFPTMKNFIEALKERNYQNRKIALIENGTWAPVAAKKIKALFEESKNISFANTVITIKGEMTEETDTQIDALVKEIV